MRTLFLLFLIFLFSGCSTIFKSQAPSWIHENLNDKQFLYGKGSGTSYLIAKEQALLDISSAISMRISSFEQSSKYTNTSVSQNVAISTSTHDIALNINPLTYHNVEVVKSTSSSGVFYVLVRVNLVEFRNSLFSEAKPDIEMISNAIQLQPNNNIERLKISQSFQGAISRLTKLLSFISYFDEQKSNEISFLLRQAKSFSSDAYKPITFFKVDVLDQTHNAPNTIKISNLIDVKSQNSLKITLNMSSKKLFGKEVSFAQLVLSFSNDKSTYKKELSFNNEAETLDKAIELNYQAINKHIHIMYPQLFLDN